MKQIISKKEFDELMKIKGEVRGMSLKIMASFILREKGKEGLKKIEETITKLGYPIKYKDIKTMTFYPVGLEAITELALKRIFNFGKEEFKKLGEFAPKSAIVVRLFMRYLFSMNSLINGIPKMWKIYYTVGSLKVAEFNEEERYIILRLENFRLHPAECQIYLGYFPTVIQMVVGKKVTCKETKCVFEGNDYHEFLLEW